MSTPEPPEIPMPDVLDPDRPRLVAKEDVEPAGAQISALERALRDSCEYGRTLWHDVDSLRRYLLVSLPDDPRRPGPHRLTAAPTGPDDEQGWQAWIGAYAEATSVLVGRNGDSGFGLSEARREAQQRRTAANVRLLDQTIAEQRNHADAAGRGLSVRNVVVVATGTLAGRWILRRALRPARRAGHPRRSIDRV